MSVEEAEHLRRFGSGVDQGNWGDQAAVSMGQKELPRNIRLDAHIRMPAYSQQQISGDRSLLLGDVVCPLLERMSLNIKYGPDRSVAFLFGADDLMSEFMIEVEQKDADDPLALTIKEVSLKGMSAQGKDALDVLLFAKKKSAGIKGPSTCT